MIPSQDNMPFPETTPFKQLLTSPLPKVACRSNNCGKTGSMGGGLAQDRCTEACDSYREPQATWSGGWDQQCVLDNWVYRDVWEVEGRIQNGGRAVQEDD